MDELHAQRDCGSSGLIIQADNTLFRVSRDLLAYHSSVFRDMLSLPTPKDAEMMDGCPFVNLPDSAEDTTVFLKAMIYYDFFEPAPAPTTLSILSGVLRLSHKYEVDALRKRPLLHISQFHPTTLQEWEQLGGKSIPWLDESIENGYLSIVILARQFSIDWILPAAFYRVCQKTTESSIINGDISESELDPQDKVSCFTACRQLEVGAVTRILDFLWTPLQIPSCSSPDECMPARIRVRRSAEGWRPRPSHEAPTFPLDAWEESDWRRLAAVCDVCLSSMKSTFREAKQTFWDGLPKLFDLPDWEDLEKIKVKALE
ncbi:hypothetical protein B0H11DRAFT_2289112 [Mycena galericulata]|nr:hypothetical protein B0H11DRAFT_2289112 [Mycena galericulata]